MGQRILLIGGHGQIALLASPLLVAAGHHVDAVIRNPDHSAEVAERGARPIVADVEGLDVAELADLVRNHDVVIWSAGAGGGSPERTVAVDREAAIRSMDATGLAQVRRYVMVSYFGSSPDHGVPVGHPFHAYAEAKAAADEHLRATDLDWTILAPSTLTSEAPTGGIAVGGDAGTVTRADVAAVLAATVDREDLARRTIAFNNGRAPIDSALATVALDPSPGV